MKKMIYVFNALSLFSIATLWLGCNAAPTDFNAPTGATVILNPITATWTFGPGATASQSAIGLVVATVNVPRTVPGTAANEVATQEIGPGNKIFLRISCNGGPTIILNDGSVADAGFDPTNEDNTAAKNQGTIATAVTNDRGVVSFGIAVPAPGAPGATYNSSCSVDIGTASATYGVTATQQALVVVAP